MRNRQKLVRAIIGVTPVIAVAGMGRMAWGAAAPVYPFEPFPSSYSDAVLTGQGNWSRASTPATTTAINVSTGANLTNTYANMPLSTGKGVTINGIGTGSGSNTGADRNAFGVATTTGTLYYSFLLDVNALTGSNTTGGVFISLNNTALGTAQTSDPTVIPAGVAARIDPTDGTKYDLGIFGDRESLADTNWSTAYSVGTGASNTHLIVASYTIAQTAGGPVANTSSIWIDPSASSLGLTAPTATLTTTGGTAQSSIGSLLLRQTVAPFLTLDELRVGTSWAAVTPTLTQYFDVNGTTAGSGIVASTIYNWEDATGFWNSVSDGTGTAGAWAGSGYAAVFSAGTDGAVAYTVNISAASEACSALNVTTGSLTITGNALNISTGNIAAAAGASVQLNNSLNAGTNFSVISGSGTTFGGTVVLNSAATYSGTTTVNNATLQIGAGGATGSIPVNSVITDSGTIAFNRSGTLTQGTDFDGLSAGISGTGNIVQMSGGTLVLNAATNTYSGMTTASAGTIQITNSLAAQKSTVDTSGAGTIDFGSLSAVTVGGLTGGNNYASSAASLAITVDGTVRSTSFGGAITGSGTSLTAKLGGTFAAPFFQSLYGVNTYGGGTTISTGMLQFNTLTSMPAVGTATALKGATLSVRAGGAGEWTNDPTPSTPGALGALISGVGGQGSPVVWTVGSALGISTLTSVGGSFTYAGNIGGFQTASGTSDNVSLHKTGAGTTLTLTGTNNTISGPVSVDNNGGILTLQSALPNAGQSFADYGQTVPTVTIGNAGGDNTNQTGSADAGVKILVDNALPSNSVIDMGTSITAGALADSPSSLFQLYDGFVASGSAPSTSISQTVAGFIGGSGRVKVGISNLTIDVPTGKSYSYNGTLRTDFTDSTNHGVVTKNGAGEQDFLFSNGMNGDFILNNGTIGMGDGGVFGSNSATARLIINGGELKNINNSSITLATRQIQINGSFTYDLVNSGDTAIQANNTITLGTANPVITVISGTDLNNGQLIMNSIITDNGNNFGFTKAGTGNLTLGASSNGTGMNSYSGPTTISAGFLQVNYPQRIGNGSSDVNLSGGQLEYNGGQGLLDRTLVITNPIHVTADSTIAFFAAAAGITDGTDPNGVSFQFTSNTFDQTGGKLTFSYQDTAATTTVTYRPRFTGNGFTYGGPIEVDNGATGTHPTVLEFGNSTGTQTFNGNFTGTGSISRLTNGTTLLGGSSVVVGGVSVANSSTLRMAQSTNHDHVMNTAALSIGTSGSQLDLTNNKLIVTSTAANLTPVGSWNGSAYSGVTGSIVSGRGTIAGGQPAWNGSGIVTSMTQATMSNLTTLGIASGHDVTGISGTATATFAGQTVHANDALVMYTFTGDANLDGKINADDYFQIDSNYNKNGNNAAISFHDGDFNYDGKINGDDYGMIDAAFAAQNSIMLAPGIGGGLAGVSAVPEPASIMGLVVMGAAAGLRRRRRTR